MDTSKSITLPTASNNRLPNSSGFCHTCKTVHRLESIKAIESSLALMKQLETNQSIDLFGSETRRKKALSTDYLFGPARGKMFGIMECMRDDGTIVTIRAFSGQYNGLWEVPGWAPPLFDVDTFFDISRQVEKQIKAIGRELDNHSPHAEKWQQLKKERRLLSQALMKDIHSLYRLTNFKGKTTTLQQAFWGETGIPTGTGDCSGPKLLNYAAKLQLTPIGMAEFYWGRENKSASRQHGVFYPSCKEKCQPILGFLLCGLDHSCCQ